MLNLLGPVRYTPASAHFQHSSQFPAVSAAAAAAAASTPGNGGGGNAGRVHDEAMQRYMPLLLSPVMRKEDAGAKVYVPRRKMVFTWQAPLMFMSYSVCAFLAGLTVLVGLPILRGDKKGAWGDEGWNVRMLHYRFLYFPVFCFLFATFAVPGGNKSRRREKESSKLIVVWGEQIAVMYLTAFGAGLAAFVYCSFWVYHYVHVEHDGVEREEHREAGPWGLFPAGYD